MAMIPYMAAGYAADRLMGGNIMNSNRVLSIHKAKAKELKY